ncbi:unnamed protein product, partial [Porites evermanni]
CRFGFLKISDDNNRILGTYCGKQLNGKDVLVTGNRAFITIVSDENERYPVFQLTILNYQNGCGSVINNTLTSPGFPTQYPNNMHCVYNVSIPPGKALNISFPTFIMQSHSTCG